MKITEKNGYKISEITLGTVQMGIEPYNGKPYGINNVHGVMTYDEAAELLRTALESGIVSFDTAKGYGRSEEVLGKFFGENPYEKTLITKVGFDKESPSELKDSLFAKVKDSAKKLGLEKIPVVLLHSQTYLERYGQALTDAMCELKKEGLVESVGISFSDKSRLMELTNPEVYDSIQIPLNLFDNEEIRSGNIKALADAGVAVYIRSVYLQGLFFKDTNTLPDKIRSAKEPLDKLHALARENNLSMAQMSLAYIRYTPGSTSLVIGCETTKQLKETVSLFDTPRLSPELVDKINEISQEVAPIVIRPWEWKL